MRAVLLNTRAAQIANGELRLQRFTSADPEVVALIADAKDPEAAVRSILSVGARALNIAATTAEDGAKR